MKLADILRKDGVISVPTDTVYGLCARINSKTAYEKLKRIKNRPENKAFPVMCADEEQINNIAIINESAKKLIETFMPGPITLVLKKREEIPEFISNGKETLAIRMATSDVLKELIIKIGQPIFMSSANKSGEPTCKNINEIRRMCPDLDGILEGNVTFGRASTIVDCSLDELKILRDGPISDKQIKEALKVK